MKIDVISKEGTVSKDVQEEMSEVYKEIGQILASMPVPNDVIVDCGDKGSAHYELINRSGTRCVHQKSNTLKLTQQNPFPERYLVMVNAEHNNYKFYQLQQETVGGDVKATWGRIGGNIIGGNTEKSCMYPPEMFWPKYFEKTAKGYEDKSKLYLTPPKKSAASKKEKEKPDVAKAFNQASVDLYALLKQFARTAVETSCVSSIITEAMVKEAKKLLRLLYERKTVNGFNTKLMELLAVCPRKVDKVDRLLATTTADFPRIISREESLVDAMEALIVREDRATVSGEIESFDALGVEVYIATDKQKAEVLKHLSPSLQSQVKTIYRVINTAQKKRFDAYLKEHDIKTVKQLWHGSRNENWLSIINNGLLLKPNAVITGKMFGNGIYFAPKSTKSWNYTSYRGTRYANGNSSTAFMGLYATAYGEPLDCDRSHSYTATELNQLHKNCVHAHAGSQLVNDEIIYYDEAAMTLNYIVEFA